MDEPYEKSKKNPVNFALFSRVLTTQHRGERLVYQGSNKLNLLPIKDIFSDYPHPLYSKVDRMMVMDRKYVGVKHISVSLVS